MQRPFLHTEDGSTQIPVATTQRSQSADQGRPGRNALTPIFPTKADAKRKWYRSRKGGVAALAAAILLFLVLLQSNGVLASQIFSFFHQVKPVIINIPTLKNGDYVGFSDLGNFSDQTSSKYSTANNLTKTQVMHAINFPLAMPGQLPEDLKGTKPFFSVLSVGYVTFTFSSAKTHAYLVKNGYGNIPIPAHLAGATFRMGRADGFEVYYSNGPHELLFSEAPNYEVQATGNASVKNLDDFMLLLPNLSPLLRAEYMLNNGDMLEPIPTNAGAKITSVTVHHVPGFLVTGKNMEGPMLLWEENGIAYSIDGEREMSASQMLALANSFHS